MATRRSKSRSRSHNIKPATRTMTPALLCCTALPHIAKAAPRHGTEPIFSKPDG